MGRVPVAVVPGHGAVGDLAFVDRSLLELRTMADLGRRLESQEILMAEALAAAPWPIDAARETLERAIAQLNGELDLG